MTVSLSPSSLPEGAPARSVPAGIGGMAAQSGEKRDDGSLREFHVNYYVVRHELIRPPRSRHIATLETLVYAGLFAVSGIGLFAPGRAAPAFKLDPESDGLK